jgi:hypothetical protein
MLHPAYEPEYKADWKTRCRKSDKCLQMYGMREAKGLDIANYLILMRIYNLSVYR